ncbi:MAG: GntP family permease [Treponema sp.]|nr:GntP family permease [Treponema sp.]
MTTIGIIGFLAAILVMITGAYRGVKPITLTLLASIVVILTNGMDVWYSLARVPAFDEVLGRGGYAFGFGRAINSFFFLFVASSIYAVIMDKTGCTGSIGAQMVKWFGAKNVMVVVYFFTVILTFGGVNLFVVFFAALPIAYVMFKEANLPRALIMAPMGAGGAGITMTTLPGTPSLTNMIPGRFLETPLTSAPVFSLVLAAAIVALTLLYFRYAEKAARRKNEAFTFPVGFDATSITGAKAELPHPAKAFIPILFLPLFIILSSAFGAPYARDGIQLTVLAMVLGAVLCMVLNHKKVTRSSLKTWTTDGATNGLMALMALAAIIGFGAVVSSAPAFQYVIAWVMGLELSVYWKGLVSTGVISGIVGSSSGGAQIVMENLTPHFIAAAEAGANIQVLHRLLAMSAGTLDTLPHVSAIFVFLGVIGCTHKEAYKYLFWGTLVIPTFVTIMGVIAATIIW